MVTKMDQANLTSKWYMQKCILDGWKEEGTTEGIGRVGKYLKGKKRRPQEGV